MRVVDASVALKWFKDEAGSTSARALLAAEPLIAPELILAEVLNAAWKASRLGLMTGAQVERIADGLPSFVSRIVPLAPLAVAAARLACRLDHPIYDCFYLALAQREACSMVTADARLARKVLRTEWEGLVFALDADRNP